MNHDEKFQQRWDFRRREVDEDSLSDETTDKRHKSVTDIVLLEDDKANDTLQCQRNDNVYTLKTLHKKVKSNQKKNLMQKRSNKKKRNGITTEVVMLADLKVFAGSLIRELTVARENMFAHMRDEMRKLVSSRPNLEPLKKNKVCPLGGVQTDKNLKSNEPNKFSKVVEEVVKHGKLAEWTTTNKLYEDESLTPPTAAMIKASDSDQAASLSYLTLPTVLPKLHFQNHRNSFPMKGGPTNSSGSENNFYHRFSEFDPEQGFRNFSQVSSKSVGFIGQNCIQTPGFPVPLHQGTKYGLAESSLTSYEHSFLDNIGVCPRTNGSMLRFPFEGKSPKNISSNVVHKTAGEFVTGS